MGNELYSNRLQLTSVHHGMAFGVVCAFGILNASPDTMGCSEGTTEKLNRKALCIIHLVKVDQARVWKL